VYAKGALFGLTAVSIWAGWIVVARLGLRTSLAPEDITAIHFVVTGLILLPYLLRHGLAVDRLGWHGVVLIAIGGGDRLLGAPSATSRFRPWCRASSRRWCRSSCTVARPRSWARPAVRRSPRSAPC
jgi:hypothetical protein